MRRKTFNIVWVSAWLLAASAPHGWALSVTPPRTEIRLPPGGTTTAILTVSNPHTEAYDVELSEKPWFIYPENRQIQVDQWLKLPSKKHFRLKPGKSRDVKITILCPKEALGELMGMVSFTYQGMKASMITPMISTAVYLDVTGTEKRTGEIVALVAGTRNGRFVTGVQVKATGNVRLRPTGTIRLLNDKGQVVSEYSVPETNPTFPGTVSDFVAQGPDTPPPAGHYTLSVELQSGDVPLKADRGLQVDAKGDVVMDKEMPKP